MPHASQALGWRDSPVGPGTLELGTMAHIEDAETEGLRSQVTPNSPGAPAADWQDNG